MAWASWKGAFYYELGDIISELQGAYVYADYSEKFINLYRLYFYLS